MLLAETMSSRSFPHSPTLFVCFFSHVLCFPYLILLFYFPPLLFPPDIHPLILLVVIMSELLILFNELTQSILDWRSWDPEIRS